MRVEITDTHSPSFVTWPVNNDRTAWRPFGLPMVLVVPHMRDASGAQISSAAVWDVAVAVEGAPDNAPVAGHDHVGMRFPDREIFTRSISTAEILARRIDRSLLDYTTADGEAKEFADAEDGDLFSYTTSSGVTAQANYVPHADYYDLSDIEVEVETLPPGRYNLIYSCKFYLRVVATRDTAAFEELVCVNINQTGEAMTRFSMNHPGEVLLDFFRMTPPIYMTAQTKSQDQTLRFYRPFTDAFQDIYDEQKFIKSLNWVSEVPYEGIPYLSQLLGWDIPYFPESLDQLRRLILKRTKLLQDLKGSERAIRELLNLFGFTVLISNLWYSADGQRFIAPAETLPPEYQAQEIDLVEKFQVEPVLSNYATDGFGQVTANLLFRPQRLAGLDPVQAVEDSATLTVVAYLVDKDGDADVALAQLVSDMEGSPEAYGSSAGCTVTDDGFIEIGAVNAALEDLAVVGYSQLLVADGVVIDQVLAGSTPPLRMVNQSEPTGVVFSANENKLTLNFSHFIEFDRDATTLYVFAAYQRQEAVVPLELADFRSNRFSIQILTRDGTETIPGDVLDFVLDFIHRVKAFHSLLDVIRYKVEVDDSYLVTDLCLGGDISQRFDTALGRTQVPPAIIPTIDPSSCENLTPVGLGYKDADILYRRLVLGSIIEEYAAWQALSGRAATDDESLRLAAPQPDGDGDCRYTHLGQDRVVGDRDVTAGQGVAPDPNAGQHSGYQDLSPIRETVSGQPAEGQATSSDKDTSVYSRVNTQGHTGLQKWCDLDARTDYCFKGRPEDELALRLTPATADVRRPQPCGHSMGLGVYWVYPTVSVRVAGGVGRPQRRSSSRRSTYSGGATDESQRPHLDGVLGGALTVGHRAALPVAHDNFLGRLLRSYGEPAHETIHYSNRVAAGDADQSRFLALQRPSLEIELVTMHIPGCRFATMNKLVADFTHPTYRARPWDDGPSADVPCCRGEPGWLNAALVEDANGDLLLTFDDTPLVVLGNGLTPDIPNLGDHNGAAVANTDVIHSIFSSNTSGHEAVSLELLEEPGTGEDTVVTTDPLFVSAQDQGAGSYLDFIDGYKAEYGFFDYTGSDLGNGGLYEELFAALGVPGVTFGQTGGTGGTELLFKLGSGIRDGSRGLRLDCGCNVADVTASALLPCSADLFLDQDSERDFSGDQVWVHRNMVLEENAAIGPYVLDGSIPSMLEVLLP